MRVLFVAHSFPRHDTDGAGAFLLRLAVALAERGHAIAALAPSAPGLAASETLQGIPVHRFRYAPRRFETLAYGGTMVREARRTGGLALGGFLLAAARGIRRAARAHGAELIHAHWWFPSGLAAVASAGDLPVVTTMHGTDVRLARDVRLAAPLLRLTTQRSAATSTVSRWLAERVRAIDPGAEPEIAPMPAATERFTPGGARDASLVLFVGRLNAQKGIATLVRALAQARAPVRLRVIGDGPDGPALRAEATRLGLAARIDWQPALPQTALAAEYRRAGMVVVPSIDEGLGMVAVEAQLCGAPVIASDSGGLPDVVRHARTGLLVPPGDPAALAAAIDDLVLHPERAHALADAGRHSALAVFAPEAVAARYEAIYQAARDA